MHCNKCGLQYSSYCVDCAYVKTEILKLWNEQERGSKNESPYN